MISSLKGQLIYLEPTFCIIECSGVGFRCFISSKTLGAMPKIGEQVQLFTYMSVKEDAIDLYGFTDMNDLSCFKLITSVSGVGPKIGIALLSTFNSEQISMFIAGNDPKSLTAASGVGLKLAQRIILELKDKVTSIPVDDNSNLAAVQTANSTSNFKEAISALVALGYSQSEASLAVGKCPQELPVEQLIKEALKILVRMV